MISSTAFPKVTFISAPMVSPILFATLSVAWLRRPARGMIAMAFIPNTIPGERLAAFAAMPIGTKTSNTLIMLESMMDLAVSQKRRATFFGLAFSSLTTSPSPSTCGGGAGGGMSVDVLSATLLAVGFEGSRARPLRSDEGNGGMFVESFRRGGIAFGGISWFLRGRVGVRLVSLESGEGPCALVLAQERMRSAIDSELGEVFFIDVESDTQMGLVSWRWNWRWRS